MLTERIVRDAKPGWNEKRQEPQARTIWDKQCMGLGLQVTPAGVKNFIIRYKAGDRKRQAILARAGQVSLTEARKRAGAELVRIRAGETDPLEREREAREAPTVEDGLRRFFDEYVPRRMADGRMSERTRYDYQKQAARTVLPALGKRKIKDVRRADIEKAVAPRGPVQRNRTLALLHRLFALFETWEYRSQNDNPVKGVEKAREQPRDRTLAPSEIGALGKALDEIDAPYPVACIRFLLMTGWRSGEALALKWENINFETGEITLPHTKAGRQVRTVAALALEAVADVPRINSNPYVFAGARGRAISYKTLRDHFARACRQAGIEDCRPHDIRRSIATTAAASGLGVFLLRDLLNHSTLAMASRYARRANSALQEAHDASAERMAAMMAGKQGEVVPLRGRHA